MSYRTTRTAQRNRAAVRPASRRSLPALSLHDGTIEALKWLALILMALDHANKYLLHDSYRVLFLVGRTVAPLFCIILGFNLARPNTLERGVYHRTIKRLSLFAVIASIPYIALGNLRPGYILFGWWPLNVFETLLVATICIFLLDRGRKFDHFLFGLVFIVGGAFGEFWWPAILLSVGTWHYCRRPGWIGLILVLVSTAAFFFINRNFWAFGALPIVYGAQFVNVKVPRTKLFFYVFYPAHLAVIFLVAWRFGL